MFLIDPQIICECQCHLQARPNNFWCYFRSSPLPSPSLLSSHQQQDTSSDHNLVSRFSSLLESRALSYPFNLFNLPKAAFTLPEYFHQQVFSDKLVPQPSICLLPSTTSPTTSSRPPLRSLSLLNPMLHWPVLLKGGDCILGISLMRLLRPTSPLSSLVVMCKPFSSPSVLIYIITNNLIV
jgi:hypothetical protein